MTAHHSTRESVIRELDTDQSRGLNSEQIAEKHSRFGENKLREKKKKSYLQRFIDQFKDVMILILLAAAAVSFVIACLERDPGELFEPVLILLIVILNAVMGETKKGRIRISLIHFR